MIQFSHRKQAEIFIFIVNWLKLDVSRCKMFEFAHFITPYCCIGFKQFFSGVLIMMDNSCLLNIHHIFIVHSMHSESNSIKTINEIKKSSCSRNLDICSFCLKIGVNLYFRRFLYSFDTNHCSSSTAFAIFSSVCLKLTTTPGTDDTIRTSLWEVWVGSACVSCVFSSFLPTNVQSWGQGCPDLVVDHCQICCHWETNWQYWHN